MNHRSVQYFIFFLFLICCFPSVATAYVGPGTGMSAVGVFLAVVMGLVIALFGFLWYPFKRLLRACKRWAANRKDKQTV